MANELEIIVVYPVSGLATITVAIYNPDLTIRDSQTAVALVDTDHLNLYSNAGAITIEPGDIIKPAVDGVNFGNGGIYEKEGNDALFDLSKANRVINTDTTPWQLEYRHNVTGELLLTQKMTNTLAENITSINNVLGGLTAP